MHDRILLRRKPYGHGSGARTIPTAADREDKHLGVLIVPKPRITQKPPAPEKAARLSVFRSGPALLSGLDYHTCRKVQFPGQPVAAQFGAAGRNTQTEWITIALPKQVKSTPLHPHDLRDAVDECHHLRVVALQQVTKCAAGGVPSSPIALDVNLVSRWLVGKEPVEARHRRDQGVGCCFSPKAAR